MKYPFIPFLPTALKRTGTSGSSRVSHSPRYGADEKAVKKDPYFMRTRFVIAASHQARGRQPRRGEGRRYPNGIAASLLAMTDFRKPGTREGVGSVPF